MPPTTADSPAPAAAPAAAPPAAPPAAPAAPPTTAPVVTLFVQLPPWSLQFTAAADPPITTSMISSIVPVFTSTNLIFLGIIFDQIIKDQLISDIQIRRTGTLIKPNFNL